MHHARLQQQAGGGGGSLFIEVAQNLCESHHDTTKREKVLKSNQNWARTKPRKLKEMKGKARLSGMCLFH